jgi:16S rRNA (guanine966-N2)-methyltransferase
MRIVGGKFAGRDLTSPKDFRVRPTGEQVRAALVGMLGADLAEARILDLFAGTGALGLEAISRGARYADFVEFRPSSLHALKANIAALGVQKKSRIFKKDALPFAAALEADRYDIVFVDPPYNSKMLDRLLDSWRAVPFARIFAAEHAAGHVLPPGGRKRLFDDTAITVYHRDELPLRDAIAPTAAARSAARPGSARPGAARPSASPSAAPSSRPSRPARAPRRK